MTPQEIYSQFLTPGAEILHVGCGDRSLEKLVETSKYVGVGLDESLADLVLDVNKDADKLPKDFDYVIIDDLLESVDEPIKLLAHLKKCGTMLIVYERKYSEMNPEDIKPHWKNPWKDQGLEYTLTNYFDYVNTILMGDATLYRCCEPSGQDEHGRPDNIGNDPTLEWKDENVK